MNVENILEILKINKVNLFNKYLFKLLNKYNLNKDDIDYIISKLKEDFTKDLENVNNYNIDENFEIYNDFILKYNLNNKNISLFFNDIILRKYIKLKNK